MNVGTLGGNPDFKYVAVDRRYWTQEELDALNIQFTGTAKWLFGN